MTSPFPPITERNRFGSAVDQQEWDLMLQRRRQLVEEITNRMNLANRLGSMEVADTVATTHNLMGQNEDGSPTWHQQMMAEPPGHELNQLLGAAKYYGIADADKIPPMRLKQIVEAQRLKAQPTETKETMASIIPSSIAEGVVAMGLGTANELLSLAQRLPFVGDAFARMKVIQGADQYMGMAGEAIQANMTREEASGFRTAARMGGMVGYALPASGAWLAAGAAGRIGFVANAARLTRFGPLTRAGVQGVASMAAPATYVGAAVQGAASAALIETGDKAGYQWEEPRSFQEKMWTVGMGAAAGVGFTYLEGAVPRVWEKIRGAFRGKTDPWAPGYEPVNPPGEETADWYFEADHQLAGPGGAGGGPGAAPPPPPGQLPGQPRLAAETGGPYGADPFTVQRPATARMAEQPGAATGPDFTVEPLTGQFPGQPRNQLMSPQRAAIEERLNLVTEQRDLARRMVETDGLTGNGNKVALERARANVDADPDLGWVVFDGKQFKAVNDTHGHVVGDGVLANFSRAITQAASELNIPNRVFRQGGDEFAAIVPKENMQALLARATELSYQKVGSVETKLNGYAGETFAEADLMLMQNKRGGVFREQDVQAEIDRALYNQYGTTFEGQLLPQEMGFGSGSTVAPATLGGRPGFEITPGPRTPAPSTYPGSVPAWESMGLVRVENGQPILTEAGRGVVQRAVAGGGIRVEGPDAAVLQQMIGSANYPAQLGQKGATPELSTGEAAAEGATLTKQAVLLETGDINQLGQQHEIGVADVAETLISRNPGGISVIRGIGDAGKTIRQLVQAQADFKLKPSNFRIVKRGDSMDMLITDGLPITNKRAAQYAEHGFFEGQTAVVGGQEVVVESPGAEFTTVTDPYTGTSSQIRTQELLPGNGSSALSSTHISEIYPKAPELYSKFVGYAMDAMNAGSETLGIVEKPGWLDNETSTQLPRLLDEFLDAQGVVNPAERLAVEAYFNVQRVEDFRMEVPDEAAELEGLVRELNVAAVAKPPVNLPIEDIAATKGFNYVPIAGERGGVLNDALSDLRVPVESPEAALEFLRAFNREVPDYTPEGEIPFELTSAGPHGASPGDASEPVYVGGDEQVLAIANRDLGRVTRGVQQTIANLNQLNAALSVPPAAGGGGGGALPPQPPPPPPPASPPPGGPGPVTPAPRSLGAAFSQVHQTNPAQLHKALQLLDSAWLQYGEPFRRVTIRIQDALQGIGIEEGKLWEHYSDMVTAVARKHNEEHPWMEEAVDIFSNFTKRRWLRDGSVMRIHEIANYQHRLAAMKNAGYSQRDIDTQNRIDGYYDRFMSDMVGQPLMPGVSRQLFNYTAAVRQRQAANVPNPYQDVNNHLSAPYKIFADIAAKNNLQMKQLDARTLPTALIRGVMFEKHAEAPWQAMKRAWDDPRIKGISPKLHEIVTDWLQVVKHGRDPSYDVATQGIRYILNRVGVPITDSEVMGIWNTTFANLYRGALGGRPDAIFRDSIQPLLAATRIGFKPIAASYNRFLSGKTARAAMWQRAEAGGWVEEGQVQVPIAEVFEGPIQNVAGVNLLTPNAQARRDVLAAVGDLVYAMTPVKLRGGLQGTKADPLLGYTKLGEFNRLISGDAGWQVANDALAEYATGMQQVFATQQGPAAVSQMNKLMERLMDKSMADVYPQPIQNKFVELVENGDFAGAANLMANEAANSQFRYGSKESSIGIRKAGTVGRMGMMFGSFTQQYIASMREQFLGVPKSPTRTRKVAAMGVRHGSVAALLGLAGAYTGWKFSKWFWHNSLAFAGGPMGTALYEGAMNVTGRLAQATGQNLSPQQQMAVARSENSSFGDVLAGAAQRLNPYNSTLETVDRLSTAYQGPNAPEAVTRQLVTGEQGLAPDMRQFFGQPVVTPDDLNNALAGDPNAAVKFSPEEREFISRLGMVPAERRFQIYMNWRDSRQQGPRQGSGQGAGARY